MMAKTVAGQKATLRPTRVALLLAVIVASLALLRLLAGRAAHAETTFTVTNTNDSGAGSLRQAITDANAAPGADTITFDIPAASDPGCNSTSGVCTISPTTNLGFITDQVTIDGYTQPGSRPNTLAEGDNAVLKNELDGSHVEGEANGLDLSVGFPPGADSSHSVIRGLVINNFDSNGIFVGGIDTRIEGNFIGTNPSGTKEEGNVYGVGVNGTGSNNILGGDSPEARNLISGNSENGVVLGPGSSGTKVWGNYIGTTKDGTEPLGNSVRGVWVLGSSDNTIGGKTVAKANEIAFNRFPGIAVDEFNGFLANGNLIARNSIHSNGDLGIDLNGDGRTPNDGIDKDEGPNTLQNKPGITSATTTGTKITIHGTLKSTPNEDFTIRFFAGRAFEPRGYEGRTYLGSESVGTNANGEASFTKVMSAEVQAGQGVTATATNSGNNTSEFSSPHKVVQR